MLQWQYMYAQLPTMYFNVANGEVFHIILVSIGDAHDRPSECEYDAHGWVLAVEEKEIRLSLNGTLNVSLPSQLFTKPPQVGQHIRMRWFSDSVLKK